MKRLIVFDVDGTLTLTNEVHGRLFPLAIEEVLGIDGIDTDWTHYRTVTDAGVTAEIIERHGLERDVQSVRERFVALLRTELASGDFMAVPGAAKMLSIVREHPDFECAIATGTWREPLLLKAHYAGLLIEDLPLATSDDSPQREEIVRLSIDRARSHYCLSTDTPITLVGDGPWDLKMATTLQLHFVGVGHKSGAKYAIEDFTDADGFLDLVARA